MKTFIAALKAIFRRLSGATGHLEKAQTYADTWSNRLSWLAVALAAVCGVAVFCLIMTLSLLPYVTVTHTLVAGGVLGVVAAGFAYFVTSKPADMLGTASRTLWMTRMGVELGHKVTARLPEGDQGEGDGTAGSASGTSGSTVSAGESKDLVPATGGLRKTSRRGPVYNGPVLIEVTASSAEEAIAVARSIPGLTVDDSFTPVPMEGGTYTLSGSAANVSDLPSNVVLWPKARHNMHK